MKVGSKVVCVDASVKPEFIEAKEKYFTQWVEKDKVYMIRQFLNNDDIVPGVLLEEVKNEPIYQKLLNRTQEPAFGLFRFREMSKEEVKKQIKEVLYA